MRETILGILKSDVFVRKLERINVNYSNLKQESAIRNAILEIFNNEHVVQDDLKAFAEHPRSNDCRVDLSIVRKTDLQNPILIEFKHQFTDDYQQLSNFGHVIQNDFQRVIMNKQTDLFILIISSWKKSEKIEFDTKWGISSNLSRYMCKDDSRNWQHNICGVLEKFENTRLDEHDIVIQCPYTCMYKFYILSRFAKECSHLPESSSQNIG